MSDKLKISIACIISIFCTVVVMFSYLKFRIAVEEVHTSNVLLQEINHRAIERVRELLSE